MTPRRSSIAFTAAATVFQIAVVTATYDRLADEHAGAALSVSGSAQFSGETQF